MRYLQGENRRDAYAALARRLMRRQARDPDPGHDRAAQAALWRAGLP